MMRRALHRAAAAALLSIGWLAPAGAGALDLPQELGVPAAADMIRAAKLDFGGYARASSAGGAQTAPPGSQAAPFILKTMDGGFVALKASPDDVSALSQSNPGAPVLDLTGKPVLMVFWDLYLPTSRATLDDMQALASQYGPRGLQVVAVAVHSDAAALLSALAPADPSTGRRTPRYGFPIAVGDGIVPSQYQVGNIPMFFLVGPSGRILWDMQGRKLLNDDPSQDVTRRSIDQAISRFVR